MSVPKQPVLFFEEYLVLQHFSQMGADSFPFPKWSRTLCVCVCVHKSKYIQLAQRSSVRNSPILKEINPEYSLEGLMLELKLQYFGDLMQRADSLEKTRERLKAKGEWDGRG